MPIIPGKTILNKYRILELIGEGGMARVWLAEEVTFGNRQVALKEPRSDLLPDDLQEVQRRYQREVRVCAALEQARVPNIVRSITADPYEGSVLLVMDYMSGGDLAGLLRDHPSGLPVERAVTIALDVLRALHGAHEHPMEIVHRDVKPSNILFDGEGKAHLSDFGLAQLAGVSQRSKLVGGQHPGTPLYMAPEQATSPDYLPPAADLFALGCVLFEMVTGKRYKRVRPGTAASSLRAEVTGWLDEVLARALAEDPWDRWQSAEEVAAALEEREQPAARAQRERARRKAEARARRLAESRQEAEAALGARSWREAREEAEEWLELEPEAQRAVEVLAQARRMLERPPLSRTPSGLVIATPQNLAWLLSQPNPPQRVWWEKAEMEFCLAPAGEFLMGSKKGSPGAYDDEHPQHTVTLDSYYMGRYPVTQSQYARFVREAGHRLPFYDAGWAKPYSWDQRRQSPPKGKEDHPVVLVYWDDAVAYCRWSGLRLPTEAEWEKGARGTDGRRYPWGNEWDAGKCNTREGGKRSTRAVGAYSPAGDSPYGCADMAGNVWEWCADWYDDGYYSRSPSRNPKGVDAGDYRVLRGGSWYTIDDYARSAGRHRDYPDYRNDNNGFRCCVSPTSSL